ncbi:MAG: XrtB/PEP-CTERM-associated transcriptional regulator EpsA [Accumulibacter sp.]|jgi:transcriptional regulator EpsA
MTATSSEHSRTAAELLATMRASLSIESHLKLLLWLQGDVQRLLPHQALISFSLGADHPAFDYDVISLLPGVRTRELPPRRMHGIAASLHQRWTALGGRVVTGSCEQFISVDDAASASLGAISEMRHVLFHSIPDNRLRADHLYVMLRARSGFGEDETHHFELLLPYLDAALSRIERLPSLPGIAADPVVLLDAVAAGGLSGREREILDWVRQGKTNIEIGMILGISSFTVKNHLKRIFQKINVSNRAQAVGKLESLLKTGPQAPAYG